jgi:type IV pilus assembly protein PilW
MSNPKDTASTAGNLLEGLRRRHTPNVSQRGFSLMELMVGLTIGLLVVIAAMGSMVFTQTTSKVVGDSSRMQQKADMVFRNIGFHILQAGAINLAPQPNGVAFSTDYTGFNSATTGLAGQMVSIHGLEGASNAPDTLRVSYQDNMLSTATTADQNQYGVRDCLGIRPLPAFVNVDDSFYMTGSDLMCQGASAAPAQSIADGVEDFQITYGVQTVSAGANQYRFYDASQILDWTNIQAVTICLQLAGEDKGNPQPGLVITGCRGQTVVNDGLLRRVYRRTFSLRNALL